MSLGPTPTIRPMTSADIDRVHAIEVVASADPWSRDLLAGELTGDQRDRRWLVAVDSNGGPHDTDTDANTDTGADTDRAVAGPIIGFGGVLQIVDEAHIMNLVVDPAWRRRGVARRLLGALLLDIGDRGAISATLEVRAGNQAAIELYRSVGFEQAGRRPRYYPDGTDAEIMWCHRIDRAAHRDRFEAMARAGHR